MEVSNKPQLALVAPIPYVHAECALKQLHQFRLSPGKSEKDRPFVFGTSIQGLFSKDDGLMLESSPTWASNQIEILKKRIPVYIYVSGTGYNANHPGEHLLHRQSYIALRGIFAGWSKANDGFYEGPKGRRPSSTRTDDEFDFFYEIARLEILRVKFPFSLIKRSEGAVIYSPFWAHISPTSLKKFEVELQTKIAEKKT